MKREKFSYSKLETKVNEQQHTDHISYSAYKAKKNIAIHMLYFVNYKFLHMCAKHEE